MSCAQASNTHCCRSVPRFRPQSRSAKLLSSAHVSSANRQNHILHSICTSCVWSSFLPEIATCRKPIGPMFRHPAIVGSTLFFKIRFHVVANVVKIKLNLAQHSVFRAFIFSNVQGTSFAHTLRHRAQTQVTSLVQKLHFLVRNVTGFACRFLSRRSECPFAPDFHFLVSLVL